MIFDVLKEKYRCNCKRGLAFYEEPGILDKVNKLAEWDLITFPPKKIGEKEVEREVENPDTGEKEIQKVIVDDLVEDREFLGEFPELKPGNTILLSGQVISFDNPNRMVLVLSQTGRNSLDRVVEEIINAEYNFLNSEDDLYELDWKDLDNIPTDIDEFDGTLPIAYFDYNLWKERFVKGRGLNTLSDGELCIRLSIKINDFLPPYEFILRNWDVAYKTSEISDSDDIELAKDLIMKTLRHLVKSYPRVKEEKEEEN